MKKLVLGLLGVLLLSACAKDGDSGGGSGSQSPAAQENEDSGSGSTTQNDIKIHGLPVKEFYNHFIAGYRIDCKAWTSSGYRYLSEHYLAISNLPNGRKVRVQMEVELFQDSTFRIQYKEYEIVEQNGGGASWLPINKSEVTGNWKIEQADIVIGDLGRGRGMKYNGANVIDFYFSRDVSGPGLKGANTFFQVGIRGLAEEEFRAQCPEAE